MNAALFLARAGSPVSRAVGSRLRRTLGRWLYAVLLLALPATATAALEYQVKAGFLYNFLKFTEWPGAALPPGEAYRVAVLDDGAIHRTIAEALAGKLLEDRAITVTAVSATDDLTGYHLVFVPRAAGVDPPALRASLGDAPVLLVGEREGFARAGGIIGFVQRGETIRFQVNLGVAQQADLRLTARLASLAEIVRSAP